MRFSDFFPRRKFGGGQIRAALIGLALALIAGSLPAQEPASSTEAAKQQFNVAVTLQNKGLYDLASDQWAAFLKQYPDDPSAAKGLYYRGVCLMQLQKYDDARAAFEAVLAKQPNFELGEQALFNAGLAYTNLKQHQKAADAFAKVLEKYPSGKLVVQALYNQGDALYSLGKKEPAYKLWKELLDKHASKEGDPLRADALYSSAVALQELGKLDEADKTYATFLKEAPQHSLVADAQLNRGEILMAAKNYAQAEAAFAIAAAAKNFAQADQATIRQADAMALQKNFEGAAALDLSVPQKFPKSELATPAAMAAGKYFYSAGKNSDARATLTKLLAANGDSAPEAAHWIVRSWLKDSQPGEAWKVVEAILPKAEKSPHYIDLLVDQADAAFEIPERKAGAIALYAAIAEKHSADAQAPQALYNAAFAALNQEKYDQALSFAKTFQGKYKDHALLADVKMLEAESYLLGGKYPEAVALYKELIDKNPTHAEAEQWKLRRVLALNLQKKHDEASQYAKSILPTLKTPDNQAEAQYLLGTAQLELKQTADALKSFDAALKALPQGKPSEKILFALAQSQRLSGDPSAAVATIVKLVQTNPTSAALDQAHFRLGEYASAAKDYKLAAAEYETLLKDTPDSKFAPNALFGLGWTRINQQDYAAANKTFSTLIDKFADHDLANRAHYARAVARQQLSEFAGAIDDLQPYLKTKLTPEEKSDALYAQGVCESNLKKYTEAAKTLSDLLQADPKYASTDKVLYELGWANKNGAQEAAAAAAFGRLAKEYAVSPLAAEALYHVGEYQYHQKKDYAAAAAAYYDAFNKAGKSDLGEKAGHKLAWTYYQQAEFDKAGKTFAAQLQMYPTGELAADAQFMAAECLFKQNKYKEALAAYEAAAKGKPSSKDFETLTLLHAGQAASQLKDWSKALDFLDRCAKAFPESAYLPEVQYEQGWVKKNQDKLDEAVTLFETAADAAPTRIVGVRARFMQGEILFQQKKYDEAVRKYFMVAYASPPGDEFQPWKAHAIYESGLCLETLDKKSKAKEMYQEVLDKFPKSEHVAEAKKRLEALGK